MKPLATTRSVLLFSFIILFYTSFSQTTIFPVTTPWKYKNDGSNQGTAWYATTFNDAAWTSSNAVFGFGEAGMTTNLPNNVVTTYFRKSFTVTGLTNFGSFDMTMLRDDGVIIYVNGVEAARSNMPTGKNAGDITNTTLASTDITGTAETTTLTLSVKPCFFVEGANVIAVEVHQSAVASSDIKFQMTLVGQPIVAGTPVLTRGPYLQMGTQTSIVFKWKTDKACIGRVEVGPAVGTYTTASVVEGCITTDHEIKVTGLAIDTKYFYRISKSGSTILQNGTDNFFRTLPASTPGRKIKIIAFGDCGKNDATYQSQSFTQYQAFLTANSIDAPDAWLLLGDNAYNAGTDAEYTSNFFGTYGSTILKNHKLYPSMGNHDYANTAANQDDHTIVPYNQIFTLPSFGEIGGVPSGKEEFYSYNVGNIHFIALDAYGEEANKRVYTAGSPQMSWLQADLAANTKQWTIAYWHHPPYTMGSHNSDSEGDLVAIRTNVISVLENAGVDMIINGHSHDYERSKLIKGHYGLNASFSAATHAVSSSTAKYDGTANSTPYTYNSVPAYHGTVYVLAGSTGASGGVQGTYPLNASAFSVNDGGVFYFEVDENRLDAKFIRRTGVIADKFTIMKDVKKTTNYNTFVNTPVDLTASWPASSYVWTPAIAAATTRRSFHFNPVATGVTNFTVSDAFGNVVDNFSVTATSTLPVSLLSYDVKLTADKKVNVNWSTASELNNKLFSIERSANGRDFTVIGTVNGVGNSTNRHDYLFVDEFPLTGTSYYRLSQTDIDNHKEYLGTKPIVNNAKEFEVKTVSASSGKLILQISSLKKMNAHLRIYDMIGRERKNEKLNLLPGVSNKEISLSSGIYVWEIRQETGEVTSQKVIVQ